MSTYEGLSTLLQIATLVVTVLMYVDSHTGTKNNHPADQVSWLFFS